MLPALGTTCWVFHYSAQQVSELYTSWHVLIHTLKAVCSASCLCSPFDQSLFHFLMYGGVLSLG